MPQSKMESSNNEGTGWRVLQKNNGITGKLTILINSITSLNLYSLGKKKESLGWHIRSSNGSKVKIDATFDRKTSTETTHQESELNFMKQS